MPSITLTASGAEVSAKVTASNIENAYNNSSNTSNYGRLSLSTSSTGFIYLTYDTSSIPSNAVITSITANARLRVSSTTRVTSRSCQLYSGTTAKGSSISFSSTSNFSPSSIASKYLR